LAICEFLTFFPGKRSLRILSHRHGSCPAAKETSRVAPAPQRTE
jgi:hypothetical protein